MASRLEDAKEKIGELREKCQRIESDLRNYRANGDSFEWDVFEFVLKRLVKVQKTLRTAETLLETAEREGPARH